MPGAACLFLRPLLIGHRQRERPRGKLRCPDVESHKLYDLFSFDRRKDEIGRTEGRRGGKLARRCMSSPQAVSQAKIKASRKAGPRALCMNINEDYSLPHPPP